VPAQQHQQQACPWLSIDISCQLGAQQQTRQQPVAAVNRWDNEMDGHPTFT